MLVVFVLIHLTFVLKDLALVCYNAEYNIALAEVLRFGSLSYTVVIKRCRLTGLDLPLSQL